MDEQDDPILQMWGVGKEIWADTNADEYVRDLRANWYRAQDLPEEPDLGPPGRELGGSPHRGVCVL